MLSFYFLSSKNCCQVWQYYLLPAEEQRMPGVKNPMCHVFPRIGERHKLLMFPFICHMRMKSLLISVNQQLMLTAPPTQPSVTTGGLVLEVTKKMLTPSVYSHSTSSTTRCCSIVYFSSKWDRQVFLILWWWMLMLLIIAGIRLTYRAIQCKWVSSMFQNIFILLLFRSSWIRYELLNMRMNRYFRKSKRISKIETFIRQSKLGDWSALSTQHISNVVTYINKTPSPYSNLLGLPVYINLIWPPNSILRQTRIWQYRIFSQPAVRPIRAAHKSHLSAISAPTLSITHAIKQW